jgi:hypothetical protein
MPEAEIQETLEAFHINMQALMQLQSKRRDQDPENDRPVTPHFIVSVVRHLEVAKLRSLTERNVQRSKRAAAMQTLPVLRTHPACVACGDAHSSGIVSLQSSIISAAAAVVTTPPTIVVAVSGKRQRRLLQSESEGSAAEKLASPRASQRQNQPQVSLFPNRRNCALDRTTLLKVTASSKLRPRPSQPQLHPAQDDVPSGRLPQRAANVSPLVLK